MMKVAVLAAALAACASGRVADSHADSGSGELADAAPDAYLHPDAAPDACVPQAFELLQNPALDLVPAGTAWQQVPIDSSYPPITGDGFAAQSAPYKAWLGGFTGDDLGTSSVTDVVYQDIVVPAGTTQLVISGQYVVGTTETTTTSVYDTGTLDLIQTSGTPIEGVLALTNLTATGSTWVPFSHPVTANLAGQTVRVRMTSTNDITNVTNYFFDTLSVTAMHCL